MLEVWPLAILKINFEDLIKSYRELTGRSLTGRMDAHGMKVGDYASYIAALSVVQSIGSDNPVVAIEESGLLKDHLFFTFGVHAPVEVIFEIISRTRLRVTSTATTDGFRLAVVSGTLTQWFDATLEFCTKSVTPGVREFGDRVVLLFDTGGLSLLWRGYRKRMQADKTFILEEKPK